MSRAKRGVAAGRSAQRGTSGAATGGGGRSAPDPELVKAMKPGYAISYWTPDMPTDRGAAPTNKHERAYRLIRERIEAGIYQPGQRLVIDALARELDMSQVPIREA